MRTVILIQLFLVSFLFAEQLRIIKSGNTILAVKEAQERPECIEEIERLKSEISKLKKELSSQKTVKVTENSLEIEKDKIAVAKFEPTTYVLVKECRSSSIDGEERIRFYPGDRITSYLKDQAGRIKITGIVAKNGWIENRLDLWIDLDCLEKIEK